MNIANISLASELSFFVEIVNQGSLIKAAKKLGLSKPTASRRLSQLEQVLAVKLLHRTTRRLVLTPEGQILYDELKGIPEQIENVITKLSQYKALPHGKINIGICAYFSNDQRAWDVIASFMALYPDIEITVQSVSSLTPNDFFEAKYDLFITDNDFTNKSLKSELIRTFNVHLCASPMYINVHPTIQSIKDLSAHECLIHSLYEKPYDQWHYFENSQKKTIQVSGKFHAARTHILLKMAQAHQGIALLPDFMIRNPLGRGQLQLILEETKFEPASVYITLPRRVELNKRIEILVDYLKRNYH
jgi:DNA-binding transcriptional LysR family regulator